MNLSTVVLIALLALNRIVQEHRGEWQQVDQVDITKVTGTIEKMDAEKRVMTLKLANGKKKTFKVEKSVKDLGFLPGDRVQVSYAQEIIVMAEQSDKGAAHLGNYGAVDVEAEGEKPALVKVDTSEIIGKIVSIDPMKRRFTFEDSDGKKRNVKLSYKIEDLDRFKPGETINMTITDETVVEVDPWDLNR